VTLIGSHLVLNIALDEVMPDPSPCFDAICLHCGRPGRLPAALVGKAVACPGCRRFQIFAVASAPACRAGRSG
jgi:hypothetical protein